MARFCPSCNVVLTASELQRGHCPECGATLGFPVTETMPAAPVTPEPFSGPIRTQRPPGIGTKLLATTLFVLTLGSFFLPWGMFLSMYTGFCKGGSVCAYAGCTEKATETVEYGSLTGSEKVGFCKEHLHEAPKDLTIQKGKSFGGLIAVVFVAGPALYLLWFLGSLMAVYREEPHALTTFVLLCLGGGVLLNLLSYGYWNYCHWALQYSGW